MDKTGYVYILSSQSRVLYIGVTSDLKKRLFEHRNGTFKGFSSIYKTDRIVHVEVYPDMLSAIAREKQLKGWSRKKKMELIWEKNPFWEDLAGQVNRGQVLRLRLGFVLCPFKAQGLACAQDDGGFDAQVERAPRALCP
jgi:putative endonuclease